MLKTTKTTRTTGIFWIVNTNPSKSPLPPNRPYCWPLNYLEYVKDFDLDAHVKKFKATIRANGETKDAEIINLFSFTLRDIMSNYYNNYMGDYPNCIFAKL